MANLCQWIVSIHCTLKVFIGQLMNVVMMFFTHWEQGCACIEMGVDVCLS